MYWKIEIFSPQINTILGLKIDFKTASKELIYEYFMYI